MCLSTICLSGVRLWTVFPMYLFVLWDRVPREGKMVVLSLAIGLAEQDDFANLPDLQEAPACQENQTTPEKRYWPERVHVGPESIIPKERD